MRPVIKVLSELDQSDFWLNTRIVTIQDHARLQKRDYELGRSQSSSWNVQVLKFKKVRSVIKNLRQNASKDDAERELFHKCESSWCNRWSIRITKLYIKLYRFPYSEYWSKYCTRVINYNKKTKFRYWISRRNINLYSCLFFSCN